jgi:hypothetical protein
VLIFFPHLNSSTLNETHLEIYHVYITARNLNSVQSWCGSLIFQREGKERKNRKATYVRGVWKQNQMKAKAKAPLKKSGWCLPTLLPKKARNRSSVLCIFIADHGHILWVPLPRGVVQPLPHSHNFTCISIKRAQRNGIAASLLLPGRVARAVQVGSGGLGRQRVDHDVPVVLRQHHGGLPVRAPAGLWPRGGLRDLIFCINGALMLHLPSASYRVMDVDYTYRGLTLHDPAMSD